MARSRRLSDLPKHEEPSIIKIKGCRHQPQTTAPQISRSLPPQRLSWRQRLWIIIFEADTTAGKAFDIGLLWAILLSILVVMLDSMDPIRTRHGLVLDQVEWILTGFFTLEYILRLVTSPRPRSYAFSPLGLIDVFAIAPTYLSLVMPGTESLLVIRALRLLRVFRILKLGGFWREMRALGHALVLSAHKISVFLGFVLILVLILGATMYVVEGADNGFSSIPQSTYWAVVTLTTVGYGDIVPHTVLGKTIAAFVMVVGYAIIAVPTGIVTAGVLEAKSHKNRSTPSHVQTVCTLTTTQTPRTARYVARACWIGTSPTCKAESRIQPTTSYAPAVGTRSCDAAQNACSGGRSS